MDNFWRLWGTKIGKNAFQNQPQKKGRYKVTRKPQDGPGRGEGALYKEGLRLDFVPMDTPLVLRGTVADLEAGDPTLSYVVMCF